MKVNQIILEILVNGIALYFLASSFLNIDLLKISQVLILSTIISNAYLINKKVLRNKKCEVNIKQIGVGLAIAIASLLFLSSLKKIGSLFYSLF